MNKSFVSILLTLSLLTSLTTGYAMGSAGEDGQTVQKQARVRPDRGKPTGISSLKKNTPDNLRDGTYTGSAEGYSGTVTVEVTVKGGKIVALKVLSHTETPGYYEKGASVIQSILAKGNLEVDTISGATLTSRAIIEATADALSKAGGKAVAKTAGRGNTARSSGGTQSVAATPKNFDHLNDGTYIGTGQGYAGSLSVEVVVANGVIASARLVSSNEDAPYINNALRILDLVIGKKGTAGIDVVSGATFSSNGLLNAVNDALSKAGGAEKGGSASTAVGTPKLEEENKKLKEQVAELKKRNAPTNRFDSLKDGVYQGSAKGYNTLSTVDVTVEGGKIKKINLVSSDDDKEYLDKALPLLEAIVKAGTTVGIDTVSGATFSSDGLIGAVNDALGQASGQGDNGSLAKVKKDLQAVIDKLKDENNRLKQSGSGESEPPSSEWTDGTFKGTAQGYKSAVTVEVTVKNHRIERVSVVEEGEDAQYFAQAEDVLSNILSRGSTTGVDAVSGATFSSNAILKATVRALRQSAGLSSGQDAAVSPALEEENKRLKEEVEDLNRQLESSLAGGVLHDGTFTGSARGYGHNGNKDLKLSITVENKKITAIDILDRSGETEPYYSDVIDALVPQIIEKQDVRGVDAVTGATLTSNALKNAVIQAMKASFAGGNGDADALIKDLREKHRKEVEALKERIKELEAGSETNPPSGGMDITKIPDGTYAGKAYGYHGSTGRESMQENDPEQYAGLKGQRIPIEVEVTVEKGKLTNIRVVANGEDRMYSRKPFAKIPKAMVAEQRLDVDIISGCTYSSKGLIDAVKNALANAGSSAGGSDPSGEVESLEKLLREKDAEIKTLKATLKTNRELWSKALLAWSASKDEFAAFFGNVPEKSVSQAEWNALIESMTAALTEAQSEYEAAGNQPVDSN